MNISQFELYLYHLQQGTNNFLIEQLSSITFLSFCTILMGGILTSFNPCMLSSIPIAMVYINKQPQRNLYSLFFLLGILSSLVFISFLTLLAKTSFGLLLPQIPFLKPLMTLLIGLSVLNLISFNVPSVLREKSRKKSIPSVFEIYMFGITIGITLSPCSTPILMTVITWITLTKQLVVGISLLTIYTVGYILPIIVSIISVNQFKRINSQSVYFSSIMPFAGCVITGMGSFSLCHRLLIFLAI